MNIYNLIFVWWQTSYTTHKLRGRWDMFITSVTVSCRRDDTWSGSSFIICPQIAMIYTRSLSIVINIMHCSKRSESIPKLTHTHRFTHHYVAAQFANSTIYSRKLCKIFYKLFLQRKFIICWHNISKLLLLCDHLTTVKTQNVKRY